jgi:hypothetical protein
MMRESIHGLRTFIKSPISRGRHGEESEKGKEGCSDQKSRQEDERQEEEITARNLYPGCSPPYRHLHRILKPRGKRC